MNLSKISPRILIIFLFVTISVVAEKPFVTIDSICGNVEIKKAGTKNWKPINQKEQLKNNDMLRVLNGSFALVQWSKRNRIYIDQNTLLLMNLTEDEKNKRLSQHITLFSGTAYFIIEKMVSSKTIKKCDTKIYTPSALLSIRGTSFSVNVNKENKKTILNVINGHVFVKNKYGNRSISLSAGYICEITTGNKVIKQLPLLDKDIQKIKGWVPTDIISQEIAKQLEQNRRNQTAINGNLEHKIIISQFINKSSYKGKWFIDTLIPQFFSKTMKNDVEIRCNYYGQDIKDPIILGKKLNVRYVIYGKITKFDIEQKAEISANADRYFESSVASVCLKIQLIDIEQGKVTYENLFCGEISDRNSNENKWAKIETNRFDMNSNLFRKTIIGRSINDVVQESIRGIVNFLGL